MILNVVLKMILRSWWRNKVFFLVSVASLALGLACTNLLMTYFVHEHGLEGRNPDRDRMFFLRQDDPMTETSGLCRRRDSSAAEAKLCRGRGLSPVRKTGFALLQGERAEGGR